MDCRLACFDADQNVVGVSKAREPLAYVGRRRCCLPFAEQRPNLIYRTDCHPVWAGINSYEDASLTNTLCKVIRLSLPYGFGLAPAIAPTLLPGNSLAQRMT